jgi:4-aminobutyrate aminotransferase-like enzyme/Ser/Thr protein kinase RdoA (MazF antagonist)
MTLLADSAVRRILLDHYGEGECDLAPLNAEYDQNLRVDSAAGRSVLKIVAPDGDAGLVEMQVDALRHLQGVDGSLPLPRVWPTSRGLAWVDVDVGGQTYRCWRITWLTGRPLLDIRPRPPELLRGLGVVLGRLSAALEGFEHPLLARPHSWDVARGGWVFDAIEVVPAGAGREILQRIGGRWANLRTKIEALPRGVVHGDANDHNVLVDVAPTPDRIVGLFDFGDMVSTCRVCEVAVAGAYAAFHTPDPIAAIAAVVAGFDEETSLSDAELDVVIDLVRVRLAISVVVSARRAVESPGEEYFSISECGAWDTLRALDGIDPGLATARVRDACGRAPFPSGPPVVEWLNARASAGGLAPILGRRLGMEEVHVLDLSVGSPMLGADPSNLETTPLGERIDREMDRVGATVGIGRWDEARPIYLGPAFTEGDHAIDEHRTIHLGLDLFVPAGTPVHTPLDAVVEAVEDNAGYKDYGPVVVLLHKPEGAPGFRTLWGHLDPEVLSRLEPGARLRAGERVADIGAPPRNGDWPPHLHLQLVVDPLGYGFDLPGVAPARERSTWKAWFPDPSVLCGLPPNGGAAPPPDVATLTRRRTARLGTGLSLSYRDPLHLVRGWKQFLFDVEGRAYLDLYNNVPHVGHSHPRVVEAVQRQVALLNTNTRYLHESLLDYSDALVARLPAALSSVWVVNSASEANELALRLARAHTGRREVVVQEAGYHGHTSTLVEVSPYKFDGPGGTGRADWVEVVPVPDPYRGAFRTESGDPGGAYGRAVGRVVEAMVSNGRPPGAFLAETFPSVGGQIVPPAGYLTLAYQAVRNAGGVCIADEVQTGFGRLGEAFWGFELQGVTPDIIVIGKPAGNGMPLGVVVSTREIAESFDNGMEFFSTFGGNPVSCAAGLAVLEVLDAEGLQANAARVGDRMREGLRGIAAHHAVMGDVRGLGLFLGVEFVSDRDRRDPAPWIAAFVVESLRARGVLAGTDGPHHNVLKLRGPLVVDEVDVDRFLSLFESAMGEVARRFT